MVVLSEISESSSTTYHYDVFLSFRGADTRYGFTDHLHKALLDAAIDTFFDDVEIQTGEDLKLELENAIKASRASIIVLSKDYATSTWCLDELVLILEQRRTTKHIVIPIFYHVKPTDVRKQQSSFGDAMARHKQKMEAESNEKKRIQWAQKMKQWEKALTEVANMKGEEANGWRETILIERIVKEINNRLELNKRSKIPYLIGMESSVGTIISFLKNDTTNFLTIWGIGGIGKTYLANYVFKLHYLDFERSSFLEDIERRCTQPNTLLDLQKQLLKDIGDITSMDISNANVATSKIEKLLLRNKTLLVLDGIDHFEQLDALIGIRGLHPGSKIIITTKDASLTEKCRLFMIEFPPNHTKHLLNGLNQEESQQLLGLYAFNGNYPNESYIKQARKIVEYCGGHPLALTVLGSSLRKQDVVAWKDTIKLLHKEPNTKIQQVLKISFDSLPSENDKELFKHIACFFIGKDREFAEAILKECDMIPTFGFSKLIDRCLLTVGPGNELMMHQLIQELGRDLVRQESPKEPCERSRLWHHKESYDVLKQEKGTPKIQGLVLDLRVIENYTSHQTSSSTEEKYRDDIRNKIGALSLVYRVYGIFTWIWCFFSWVFLLHSSYRNKLEIRTNAFNTMDKLRLLQLDYVQLHGSYKHFPTGLRWLSMHGFPLRYLPYELQLENIVALDMSYSNLQHLWKNPKLLRSLKFLILSCCHELVSVGGFDGFPLLERLILAGCGSLVEVCESIGNCDRLLLLDLNECGKLKKIPRSIRRLKRLRTLSMDGCSNLGEFPVGIKDIKSLDVLKANNVNIKPQVSSSVIVDPRSLKSFTISLPNSLVILSLRNNNLSNESFPVSFDSLSMLKELDLDGNQIDSLPDCVRSLSMLRVLSLFKCRRLKTVLYPPTTVEYLHVNECDSLEKVTFHPEMSTKPSVLYEDTNALTEIEGILKKQVLSEIDEEKLCRFGWINRQDVKDNEFPTMIGFLKAQGQTLRVERTMCGHVIFTTYFQGNRLPDWITHRSSGWWGLHFSLPSSGKNCRIRGLNVCIVTSIVSSTKSIIFPRTTIINTTKDNSCKLYGPRKWVSPEINEQGGGGDIVWLSHWVFGNNEFEDGDEVSVYVVDFVSSYDKNDRVDVKEYGVSVVYDDDDGSGNKKEDPLTEYKSWKHPIAKDIYFWSKPNSNLL